MNGCAPGLALIERRRSANSEMGYWSDDIDSELDEAKAIGSSEKRQLSQEKRIVLRKFENLTMIASTG